MDKATLDRHHVKVQAAARTGDRDVLVSALMEGVLALLRGTDLTLPIDWGTTLRESMTKRGRIRFLVNPRPAAGEHVRVFMERKRWHSGHSSASLWGPMISAQRVGVEEFDRLDTLALLVVGLVVGNIDSSASFRWADELRSEA